MMRTRLIILFGFSLVLPLAAQNLLDTVPANKTNETFGLNISLDQVGKTDKPNAPLIQINTNAFAAPVAEEPAATNEVKNSKVGFLISTGVEYADEGEYEEAEKAYRRALEVDAEDEDILFRLGTLYVSMERFEDAVEIFTGLAERFPENALPHNNLSWCYATAPGIRNKVLALRHAREAIISAPSNPSMWNTLAEAYYMAGDYEKALRSAEYALELLLAVSPESEARESFVVQISKIRRAQEALDMLNGIDPDE